jgi:DNA invertase Pin-like site-specific DNA recombinase
VNAAIYARVSTDKQEYRNQLEVLTAWAAQRGFTVVETYQENESAWRSGHQAELLRMITDAQRGKFKVILVWSLDRVSREGALAILSLVNKLTAWGCRLYSYQEPWTEAPGELGELLYALTGWVARMESTRRSERTKAGIQRKRLDGFTWGRPRGSVDKKVRKIRGARRQAQNVTPGTMV